MRYVVEVTFTISGKKYVLRDSETGEIIDISPSKSFIESYANELNEE